MKPRFILLSSFLVLFLAFSSSTLVGAQQTDPPTPDPTVVSLVDEVESLSTYNDTANTLIGWAMGIAAVFAVAGISLNGFLKSHYDKKIKAISDKFAADLLLLEQKNQQTLEDAFYKIDPRRTRIQIPKTLTTEIEQLEKLGFKHRDEYDDLSEIDISAKDRTIIIFHIPGSEFAPDSTELKNALRLLGVLEDLITDSKNQTGVGFILYVHGRLNQASALTNQYYNVVFANAAAMLVARIYDIARVISSPTTKTN